MDTRRMILDAIYDLTLSHPVGQITVGMILERSGLSRSTFYRHFRDKYDAMNGFYQAFFESLEYDAATGDWRGLIVAVLEFLRGHEEYFSRLQRVNGQNSFLEFLEEYSFGHTAKTYALRRGVDVARLGYAERSAILYACAGSNAVMRAWFDDGLRQSVDEVADAIYGCIPSLIAPYL